MKKALLLFVISLGMVVNQAFCQNIPVTDKPINNSDAIFRFAIVSDRTGGMQAGVFNQAIDKLSLMQPEFVLSVGDLIDGYTEDPKVWNAQWDEFDSLVDQLDMPFYHVPGNHDTSNKLLTEAWRSRLGRDYYHFKYKEVLFLALNTDEIEGGGIGPEQIAYLEKVIKENTDAKWTLLFMHRPLWSYGDGLGYEAIEKALGERPYTLFSAHHHHYRYKMHNGMEHFTLATSGGGSHLRGADVGEFHHITWVTMKEDGPTVAHLDLSGIYDKNVVHEADYEDIQVLRNGDWLQVKPYVHSETHFDRIPIKLELQNTSNRPMIVEGSFNDDLNFSFSPQRLRDTLLPNTSKEMTMNVISKQGPVPIQMLNDVPLAFEMSAGFSNSKGDSISLTTKKTLLADWGHKVSLTDTKKKIDGDLKDWPVSDFIAVSQPQYFLEGWDWKNPEDGRFKFAVAHDAHRLYLAIQYIDDHVISADDISKLQDKFYVHLDANNKSFEIEFAVSNNPKKPLVRWIKGTPIPTDVAVLKTDYGQIFEMAIPLNDLFITNPNTLRLNIGIMDHDRPENTKPSVLWWRPLWDSEADYKESGIFTFE